MVRFTLFVLGAFLLQFVPLVWAEASPVRVAKVSYFQLREAMVDRVLADPTRAELKAKYLTAKANRQEKGKDFLKKAIDANKSGEVVVPLKNFEEQREDMELEHSVSELAQREFNKLVAELYGKDYDLIFDGMQPIYYTNLAIPDLTPLIQQVLAQTDKK